MRMRKTFWDPFNIILLFLLPSRGQQEELHTQFARRMETKVVVATTWLSVGIGLDTLEQDTTCHTWFIIIIVISNYSIVIGTPCIVRSLN